MLPPKIDSVLLKDIRERDLTRWHMVRCLKFIYKQESEALTFLPFQFCKPFCNVPKFPEQASF